MLTPKASSLRILHIYTHITLNKSYFVYLQCNLCAAGSSYMYYLTALLLCCSNAGQDVWGNMCISLTCSVYSNKSTSAQPFNLQPLAAGKVCWYENILNSLQIIVHIHVVHVSGFVPSSVVHSTLAHSIAMLANACVASTTCTKVF